MPVIPLLLPPRSILRKLVPTSWQRYHFDWFLHGKGHEYRQLESDVIAMVCLFDYDTVCIRDPEAFCEMKITDWDRFPKDMVQFKMVFFLRKISTDVVRRRFMEKMSLLRMGKSGAIIGR